MNIVDPKFNPINDTYNCSISDTNYPNINFILNSINKTEYEVYLPKVQNKSYLFDTELNPILIIEVSCIKNNLTSHKRKIDFKICNQIEKIGDIIYNGELPTLNFSMSVNTSLIKLFVYDPPTTNRENYEFILVQANPYLDVRA
jgi:hypothetical protein